VVTYSTDTGAYLETSDRAF